MACSWREHHAVETVGCGAEIAPYSAVVVSIVYGTYRFAAIGEEQIDFVALLGCHSHFNIGKYVVDAFRNPCYQGVASILLF